MIAFATSPATQDADPFHEQFLELLPRIVKQATYAFRRLNTDERAEMVQEVVANAYVAFTRLVEQGKAELAYSSPLSRYAIRQVRDGRRIGTKQNRHDLYSPIRLKNETIKVQPLKEYDASIGEWIDLLVEDRHAGPAETAAARIDVPAWFRSLAPRTRRIARTLARGETSTMAAKMFNVTSPRISQIRQELHHSWQQFHGEAVAVGI